MIDTSKTFQILFVTVLLCFGIMIPCIALGNNVSFTTEITTEYMYPVTDAENMNVIKERAFFQSWHSSEDVFTKSLSTYEPVSSKKLSNAQLTVISFALTTPVLFSGSTKKIDAETFYFVKTIDSLYLDGLPVVLRAINDPQLTSLFYCFTTSATENFKGIADLRSQFDTAKTAPEKQQLKKQITGNEEAFLGLCSAFKAFSDYMTGDYENCKLYINNAIEHDPANASYYFLRALQKSAVKDSAGAFEDYNTALKYNPQLADALYNRAAISLSSGDTEKALSDYNTCIKIKPDFVNAYIQRGMIYYKQNKNDLAFADFNSAVAIDPKNITALAYRAKLFDNQKIYDMAISDYSTLIALEPNNPEYYYERGNIYYIKGDMAAAACDYRKATDAGLSEAALFLNIGNVYYNQKQYQDAINAYSRYLTSNINNADVYTKMGYCYDAEKDYDKAIAEYTNALVFGKTTQLYELRAKDYYLTAKSTNPSLYNLANSDCNEVLAADPNNVDILLLQAGIYNAQNNNDAAIANYSRVIELNPSGSKAAEAYCSRAWCYAAKGGNSNNIHATQDFQKARIVDPANPLYDYQMAEFYDKIHRAKSDTVNAYKSFIRKAGSSSCYSDKIAVAKQRVLELGGTL